MNKLPIRAIRTKKNLTQKEVASKIGVSRTTYCKWENYETFPDAIHLIALSEIFECSLDTFYFPNEVS